MVNQTIALFSLSAFIFIINMDNVARLKRYIKEFIYKDKDPHRFDDMPGNMIHVNPEDVIDTSLTEKKKVNWDSLANDFIKADPLEEKLKEIDKE